MKHVYEFAAAKSISAAVVMKGTRHVATVTAHYADGGNVVVNVTQGDTAARASAKRRKVPLAPEHFYFQEASASGWGYDKFASALGGLIIDGHQLCDHCGNSLKPPDANGWPSDFKPPKGYFLANHKDGFASSCFQEHGLKYLQAHGYQIIQAL